jgi:hypothetical protein
VTANLGKAGDIADFGRLAGADLVTSLVKDKGAAPSTVVVNAVCNGFIASAFNNVTWRDEALDWWLGAGAAIGSTRATAMACSVVAIEGPDALDAGVGIIGIEAVRIRRALARLGADSLGTILKVSAVFGGMAGHRKRLVRWCDNRRRGPANPMVASIIVNKGVASATIVVLARSKGTGARRVGSRAGFDQASNFRGSIRAHGWTTLPNTLLLLVTKQWTNAFNRKIEVVWIATIPVCVTGTHGKALASGTIRAFAAILVAGTAGDGLDNLMVNLCKRLFSLLSPTTRETKQQGSSMLFVILRCWTTESGQRCHRHGEQKRENSEGGFHFAKATLMAII